MSNIVDFEIASRNIEYKKIFGEPMPDHAVTEWKLIKMELVNENGKK